MVFFKRSVVLAVVIAMVSVFSGQMIGCSSGGSSGGNGNGGNGGGETVLTFRDVSSAVPVMEETDVGSLIPASGVIANTIYLMWMDYQSEGPDAGLYAYVARSMDGGETYTLSENLSPGEEVKLFEVMARHTNGDIYAAYVDMTTSKSQVGVLKSQDDAASFSNLTVPAAGVDEYVSRPDIAIDSNGIVYMVVRVADGTTYDVSLHLLRIDASSTAFTYIGEVDGIIVDGAVDRDQAATLIDYPSIAIDSSNHVHIVYSKMPVLESGNCRQVYMKIYDGSSFSSSVQVNSTTSTFNIANPKIAIDGNDRIHVAWWDVESIDEEANTANINIFYAGRDAGSAIFDDQKQIASAGLFHIDPDAPPVATISYRLAIAVDTINTVQVAYYSQSSFQSNISVVSGLDGGTTWEDPIPVTGELGVDFIIGEALPRVSITTDELNKVYVLGALQRLVDGPWELVFSIGELIEVGD